jgi:benzoyl-CoA reductase/2-hydroxyglutaryl-CoA dehydratase subunit BcrC/BadD/HgdB
MKTETSFENLFNENIINKWKRQGKYVFGLISFDIPEELIHAAGILPLRLFGAMESVEKAHKYISSWCCSYSRRCLEAALNGQYRWIDGIVGSKLEDTTIQLFDLLRCVVKPKFSHILQTPVVRTELSKQFFINELLIFKKKLEDFTGKTISDHDLRNSIRIYNKDRRLLRRLYETRKADNPPFSSSEILKAVISSMTMTKEQHARKVTRFLRNIELNHGKEKEVVENKVRVHISGTEIYDPEILQIIEDCGAIIVSDDLNTGSTYFWTDVDENKDPYEALAEHYLLSKEVTMQITGRFSSSITERAEYIRSLVEKFRAEGVIFLIDKGCEVFGYAYPHLRDSLKKHGIPCIRLDFDIPFSREYYAARVRAFVEMRGEKYV